VIVSPHWVRRKKFTKWRSNIRKKKRISFTHEKSFAKIFLKNSNLDTDLKIILLDQNNYVRYSSWLLDVKIFLHCSLCSSVLRNYFDNPIKLFSDLYLAKFRYFSKIFLWRNPFSDAPRIWRISLYLISRTIIIAPTNNDSSIEIEMRNTR